MNISVKLFGVENLNLQVKINNSARQYVDSVSAAFDAAKLFKGFRGRSYDADVPNSYQGKRANEDRIPFLIKEHLKGFAIMSEDNFKDLTYTSEPLKANQDNTVNVIIGDTNPTGPTLGQTAINSIIVRLN